MIAYCNYSIEYFLGLGAHPENPSRMENFLIEDNFMWYAGYGFCEQRPDGGASHIKGWSGGNRNRAYHYVIKHNLMFGTKNTFVQIVSPLRNPDGSDSMPRFMNNDFAAIQDGKFGTVSVESNPGIHSFGADLPEYLGGMSDGDVFWYKNEYSDQRIEN